MSSPSVFIASLRRLGRRDLGKVAILRRSLGGEPGADVRAFPLVERYLPSDRAWDRTAYYLVAGLWATVNTASVIAGGGDADDEDENEVASDGATLEPQALSLTERGRLTRQSFGYSVARFCTARGERDKIRRDETTSTEQRFVALLDADEEQLPHHLRQMVQLLRAEDGVRIYWVELLNDLRHWNADERWVQQKWARAFYRAIHAAGDADDDPETPANDTPTITEGA